MKIKSYSKFLENCYDKMTINQENFKQKHQLTFYEDWFYEERTAVFSFINNQQKLNFLYEKVGSYCKKSKTWQWAWDNSNTYKTVKSEIGIVRDFGIENNIEELSTGKFESYEDEGWKFSAIGLQLVGGEGLYRIPSEDLLIYVILKEGITNEFAEYLDKNRIICDFHEVGYPTFICQHLSKNSHIGFNESFPSVINEEDEYQAWCDECEEVRKKYGEWTDEAMEFANIKIVCDGCYFEIKEKNI